VDGRAAAVAEPFRVLVTGSREFDDYETVCIEIGQVMARLMAQDGPYPGVVVVHGGARGADALAQRAAEAFGMKTERHPADWKAHGKRAGFIRNAAMISLGADLALAFYKQGAGNRGTDHCARLAEKAGIPVRRVTGG
jgi:YspA, cpYpsA-related SLOG family